ncbi:MAG TPA: SPOR domain-containing protein, partial [Bacteroidales bacterium]|nr:SPOR domain-containing protein [Bacteroidales bacterium]
LNADTPKEVIMIIQSEVKHDTSILIVHEVTQELVTISKDSWAIQLGAFRSKQNADNLRRKLEHILGRKVEIIIEDNFFKVRINEIETRQESDRIVGVLRKDGYAELWLISLKARQQQIVVKHVEDSVVTVSEMKFFRVFGNDFYNIETGSQKLITPELFNIMKSGAELSKPVVSDIKVIAVYKNEEPENIERIVPVQKILNVIDIPELALPWPAVPLIKIKGSEITDKPTKPENAKPVTALQPEIDKQPGIEKAARPEPTISIQVAVFYKKAQALKAQRKISSKLRMPVEIVQQWEFYRVIIPGFYTREETYIYYPELAGLGYPGVTILENK